MGWGISDFVAPIRDAVSQVADPIKTALNQGSGTFQGVNGGFRDNFVHLPAGYVSGEMVNAAHGVTGEISSGYSIAGNNIRDTKTQALITAAPVLTPILDKILGPPPDAEVSSSDYAQDGPYSDGLSYPTNKPIFAGTNDGSNPLAPGGTTPGGNTPGGNTPGGNTPGGNSTDGYANAIRRFFGGGGNASLGAYGAKTGTGKTFPWVPVLAVVGLGAFLFLRKYKK